MSQPRNTTVLPIRTDSASLSLFDLSPVPSWVCDDQTLRFLTVNDSALRCYGYDRQHFLAMTLGELRLDEPSAHGLESVIEDVPHRARLRRGDGAVIEVEMTARHIEYARRPAWLVTTSDVDRVLQLEHALTESRATEQRYQQLFEAASEWFWETNTENVLTYLSHNVEAALGLPVAAYIGRRLADTEGVSIDPESGRASLAAVKARQPYRDFVYSRQLADGRTVWVSSSGVPVFGPDGVFLGYRGITRDITAQIAAERKLRESEQKFRELFEIAADHYWETDTQYRVRYLSPNYEAVTGIPAAEIVGRRLDEIRQISIDPEVGRSVLRSYKARKPYRDLVYSYEFPDGRKRWISLNGDPAVAPDGSFQGYRGVGVDITYRVEAEQVARLAQRRLHDAVSYVTQPFVVYNGGNCAVAYNQAFTDLHRAPNVNTPVYQGVSFAEVVAWQQRVGFYARGPDDSAVTPEALLAAFEDEREHTYHLSDGRWMLVLYRRLPGEGRVGLWTDITAIKRAEAERRKLEEQLHHAQRLESIGTLAGGVAHEINNALVPVIALTKLVARKLPEGSRERRNLDTVLGAAQHSRDLVDKILAFSRKDGEPRHESVDLGRVLRDALGLVRATVPASIRIEEVIAPVPPLAADPGQLQQVIVNLMTNAAHAIGKAIGTIGVRLELLADGTHLRLSVSDTGCGMDEATKARIFEPFFTTKAVGQGTGLGLAVVHGIIESHGGRIEVDSAPGRGTRFDLILPVRAVAAG